MKLRLFLKRLKKRLTWRKRFRRMLDEWLKQSKEVSRFLSWNTPIEVFEAHEKLCAKVIRNGKRLAKLSRRFQGKEAA